MPCRLPVCSSLSSSNGMLTAATVASRLIAIRISARLRAADAALRVTDLITSTSVCEFGRSGSLPPVSRQSHHTDTSARAAVIRPRTAALQLHYRDPQTPVCAQNPYAAPRRHRELLTMVGASALISLPLFAVTAVAELSLPTEVAGIRLPSSAVARAAAQFSHDSCPGYLFNHCMRTYLFGARYCNTRI